MDPYPRTWAEVDLPAIGHNLSLVRSLVGPGVAIALVTKADGYGHGLIPVSRYAARNGADWIAVATVQEGIALRDAGLDCPMMVLSPMLTIEAEQAVFYGLDVVVERYETAEAMSAAASSSRVARVHLKVDTGLSRFGVMPDAAAEVAERIASLPNVELLGLSQHYSSGSDEEVTQVQSDLFQKALNECKARGISFKWVHSANSTTTVMIPSTRRDLVRIGMVAYGFGDLSREMGCKPALSWKARVTAMRTVPAGTSLSYGGTYTVEKESTIATVGVGYGDGYPRGASNRGFVTVGGRQAPVIGAVCMDQLLLDVTGFGVEIGDTATLIGDGVTADDLAEAACTTAHEVLTRIMSRVPRRYDFG